MNDRSSDVHTTASLLASQRAYYDARAAGHEEAHTASESPVARRTLSDGRQFEIVKVFWRPDELERRLRGAGWEISVRRAGETFFHGAGRDALGLHTTDRSAAQ